MGEASGWEVGGGGQDVGGKWLGGKWIGAIEWSITGWGKVDSTSGLPTNIHFSPRANSKLCQSHIHPEPLLMERYSPPGGKRAMHFLVVQNDLLCN